MDYLDLEFYYKKSQSIWDFRNDIEDKTQGVTDITLWSGYVEFDDEKKYFYKEWFWEIIREIMDILKEREIFIKLSLTCKPRIYYEELS